MKNQLKIEETEDACGAEITAVEIGGHTVGVATVYAHGHAQADYYYPTYYQAIQAHTAPETYDGPEGVHHEDFAGVGDDEYGMYLSVKGPRKPKDRSRKTAKM